MKSCFVLFVAVSFVFISTGVRAADSKVPAADKFDSQPYTEDPVYKTTYPEAPGMVFDVPQDTRITKSSNGIQLESPAHYTFRKIEAQDQRMSGFNQRLGKLEERLDLLEQKIKKLGETLLSGKKSEKVSLSSYEQEMPVT